MRRVPMGPRGSWLEQVQSSWVSSSEEQGVQEKGLEGSAMGCKTRSFPIYPANVPAETCQDVCPRVFTEAPCATVNKQINRQIRKQP